MNLSTDPESTTCMRIQVVDSGSVPDSYYMGHVLLPVENPAPDYAHLVVRMVIMTEAIFCTHTLQR